MAALTLILPIYSDNVEAWRRLCQEMMGTRREQYESSRRHLGIVAERVSLLHTARGALALFVVDVEKPEGFLRRLANSTHPFDLWFKRRLQEVLGIDLTQPATRAHHNEVLLEWRRQEYDQGEARDG